MSSGRSRIGNSSRWAGWARAKGAVQRRLPGSIAHDLGKAIVRGHHPAGFTLPGEVEASRKLGVSRSAYREAVGILAAKGLVESRRKAGTSVNPSAMWHLLDPEVLGWAFQSEPEAELVWSLFELRMAIEPAAAELAASRRTYAHLGALQGALDTMRREGLAEEEGREADRAFHQTLLEATHNAFMLSLAPGISAAIHWTTIYKTRASPLPRDPLPAHERVFDAVRTADPVAAREAMEKLVQMGLDDTRASVQSFAKAVPRAATTAAQPRGVIRPPARPPHTTSKRRPAAGK